MQIELIETFLDLCTTRNFNRTAERLGVTQSTVSGRVRTLERALDCRLFARSRSGTELTTAGLRLEPHARTLRLSWVDAQQAVRQTDAAALTLRIGIQHDLLENHIADWLASLRRALPGSAFYVEADYSRQMCQDVMNGVLDLSIIYTTTAHPDLHFESLGELGYRMVSTDTDCLSEVRPERYILPNYSPAFAATHASLMPFLSQGSVSSGQAAVIRGLLTAIGGTTYLPEETVAAMSAAGEARPVADAPRIGQPIFALVHLRQRHRSAHRRMIRTLKDQVPKGGGE